MRPVALVFGSLLAPACVAPGLATIDWDEASTSTTDTGSASSSSTTTAVMTTTMDVDPGSSSTGTASGEASSSTSTTGTSGEVETTGTSTGSTSLCGDGALDDGEECDDGDLEDEDACNSSCKRERVVFVLSEKFQPDDIGGLGFADGICRQLAEKAGLPGFATYTAWLSDSTTAARERVFHGEGRYVRPDGVTVAESFAALLAGPLLAPIEIDENGALVGGAGAWTGTRPDGTAVPGSTFCADWTSAAFDDFSGVLGLPGATDANWTYDAVVNPTSCVVASHFYCFEGE